jgi:hypothetical protein
LVNHSEESVRQERDVWTTLNMIGRKYALKGAEEWLGDA